MSEPVTETIEPPTTETAKTDSETSSQAAESLGTATSDAGTSAPQPAGGLTAAALPLEIAPDIPRLARPAFSAALPPLAPQAGAPSGFFLAFVAAATFVADIGSKIWAEKALESGDHITVLENLLQFNMAHNYGGAFGLFHSASEGLRRPFFLLVSVVAVVFINALYRKLAPSQTALKWGLPLVLGGALGNVFDRVRYGFVIDFIDYRADWVRSMNTYVAKYSKGSLITDHWPTFNIADVAICIGVVLMAIDMLPSSKPRAPSQSPLKTPVNDLLAADAPGPEAH